jgi:hypothetical protein
VTDHSARDLTAAIVARLMAEGLLVGEGEQPSGGGWQGIPGQSSFIPFCVVHPVSGGTYDGPIASPFIDADSVYQVSCYGGTQAQCEWVVDVVTPALRDFRPALDGRRVWHVWPDMLGGARRDDTDQPPMWLGVPRFRFRTTPDPTAMAS